MNGCAKGVSDATWALCTLEMIGAFADQISSRFFQAWDCGEEEYFDDATGILAYVCTLLANNGDDDPRDAIRLAATVYQVLLEGIGVQLRHIGFLGDDATGGFRVNVRYLKG